VFEEMHKNRANLKTAFGIWHGFSVDGQAVFLKLRELPIPMKDRDPVIETIGMLMLGERYH
jgi:hypothetical protein